MGLSINTTPAKIAIETIPGGLDWHIRDAKLEQRQKQGEINIETEQPLILIDQYQCFAESGLKNNIDLAREQAQKGYQKLLSYIGKEARDGDAMAKIGHKANIMINIAKNSAVTKHEFGIGLMPRSRPKIQVTGGTVDIEAEFRNHIGEINGVTSSYKAGDMNFNYTATKVDVRMVSYGSIDIRYTGNNLDGYV
ncbi:MAG: DUF6470 family protein [Ruminiclostridium sp.]